MRSRAAILVLVAITTLVVCSGASCSSRDDAPVERSIVSAPPSTPSPAGVPTPALSPRIVMLGDSLTASLGVRVDEAYPAVLQQHLLSKALDYRIVNAGVSSDTSAGRLARL